MHVALASSLELALIEGDLAVGDLPAAWNERMQSYLGLDVPDDVHGVLQDIHWPRAPSATSHLRGGQRHRRPGVGA